MELEELHDLFLDELKDIYHAEKQITKALPKMIKKATAPELKDSFTMHLGQTNEQITRLEKVFELLEEKVKAKPCKAMEGIIAEGKEMMEEDASPEVMDAALIGSAQRIEHYEIAGYGTLRTWSKLMGHKEVTDLLQTTLNEEGETDKKLSKLASTLINVKANKGKVGSM